VLEAINVPTTDPRQFLSSYGKLLFDDEDEMAASKIADRSAFRLLNSTRRPNMAA
jgi:hypothetical protein